MTVEERMMDFMICSVAVIMMLAGITICPYSPQTCQYSLKNSPLALITN
jgi:hypothetical protein